MLKNRGNPEILGIIDAASTALFVIQQVRVRFSNGVLRQFERISSRSIPGAVLVVPVLADGRFLLVREYAVGLQRYELSLPTGLIEAGETELEAANRELMEEAGYTAAAADVIGRLSIAGSFMTYETNVVLARDLTPAFVGGDEPEVPGLIHASPDEIENLVVAGHLSDARSIAGLYLARSHLRRQNLVK